MSKPNPNGKGHELAMTHKGNLVRKTMAEHCFKPGQSGNPLGKPKNVKGKGFVEYLKAFFDEEILRTKDGKTTKVPRAQYFAEMVGTAALSSQQPQLRRECIGIVIDTLWPKPKEARPFIQITEHHDHRAIGFFTHVEKMADGQPITPKLVLEALRRDAAGEFDDALMAIACDEKAEDQA